MQDLQWKQRVEAYEANPSWEGLWEVYPERPAPDWVRRWWVKEYYWHIHLANLDTTAKEIGIGLKWRDSEEIYRAMVEGKSQRDLGDILSIPLR
jgi:hypothetical protein